MYALAMDVCYNHIMSEVKEKQQEEKTQNKHIDTDTHTHTVEINLQLQLVHTTAYYQRLKNTSIPHLQFMRDAALSSVQIHILFCIFDCHTSFRSLSGLHDVFFLSLNSKVFSVDFVVSVAYTIDGV